MDSASEFLPRPERPRLTGSEDLSGLDGRKVLDYWRWAYSDVLENVQRAIFAEYLIAEALGIVEAPRSGWLGYDLDYGGYKIEVKTSAYLQSWPQRRLSKIVFQIGARRQLKDDEITYEEDPRYVADAYVFAIFGDRDGVTANVLDVERWGFFVVPIDRLIAKVGLGKTISEGHLRELTTPVALSALPERIDRTRDRELFLAKPKNDVPSVAVYPGVQPIRTYRVARRATGEHAVIVRAVDANQAQLLARANGAIASLGTDVSAIALSEAKAQEAIRLGAVDLR